MHTALYGGRSGAPYVYLEYAGEIPGQRDLCCNLVFESVRFSGNGRPAVDPGQRRQRRRASERRVFRNYASASLVTFLSCDKKAAGGEQVTEQLHDLADRIYEVL